MKPEQTRATDLSIPNAARPIRLNPAVLKLAQDLTTGRTKYAAAMAGEASPASSSQGPPQETAPLTANLQVLSPSVGVNRPLSFAGIPSSTTVRQLKERIRNTLPTKPADDQQRLIHRGRLLARDSETLQDVFGAETVRPYYITTNAPRSCANGTCIAPDWRPADTPPRPERSPRTSCLGPTTHTPPRPESSTKHPTGPPYRVPAPSTSSQCPCPPSPYSHTNIPSCPSAGPGLGAFDLRGTDADDAAPA